VPLRAVFFDVGDTLVEHWAAPEKLHELTRLALRRAFGEREWYDRWVDAKLGPAAYGSGATPGAMPLPPDEELEQQTLRWYEEWFHNAAIGTDDIHLERLRTAMTMPLDLVSTPVPGAFTSVRWCKANGLTVVLVTNTLHRGDDEAWEDWRRFELADALDGIATSHTTGWQKPHRRIFERALEIARVRPDEAVMVGDRLDADIWGAKRLGLRAVWRRTVHAQPTVDVTPDASIDDLTELPSILSAWLENAVDHD